jgi:hypothetical protein
MEAADSEDPTTRTAARTALQGIPGGLLDVDISKRVGLAGDFLYTFGEQFGSVFLAPIAKSAADHGSKAWKAHQDGDEEKRKREIALMLRDAYPVLAALNLNEAIVMATIDDDGQSALELQRAVSPAWRGVEKGTLSPEFAPAQIVLKAVGFGSGKVSRERFRERMEKQGIQPTEVLQSQP